MLAPCLPPTAGHQVDLSRAGQPLLCGAAPHSRRLPPTPAFQHLPSKGGKAAPLPRTHTTWPYPHSLSRTDSQPRNPTSKDRHPHIHQMTRPAWGGIFSLQPQRTADLSHSQQRPDILECADSARGEPPVTGGIPSPWKC